MAVRWLPVHCFCVLEYEPDPTAPDERWPFRGVKAGTCAAHEGLTPDELVAVLHEESFTVEQARKRAVEVNPKLRAGLRGPDDMPPVRAMWTGSGKTRQVSLEFDVANKLTAAEKDQIRNALVFANLPRSVSIAAR